MIDTALMRPAQRISVITGMAVVSLATVVFIPPIPQDPAYHLFADLRTCLGIPNIGNTMSNLAFAFVGVLGLWTTLGPVRARVFADKADAWPYVTFFLGVGLVSIESAYYHAAPDNARLFWDRLPMTIAFMALFYAVLADRVPGVAARMHWLLPLLVALGIASLFYWDWSEAKGTGDLRFYGLVQFYPMVALPVICWLYPKAKYTGSGYLIWIYVWYGIAKILEYFDVEIFDLFGQSVSGHSLKHLAAAIATFVVWRMVNRPSVPTIIEE